MEAGGGTAGAPAPAAYEISKNQDVIMRADWPEQGGELLGCRTLLSEGHVAVLTDDAVLMPRFIVEASASDVVPVLPAGAGRRRLAAAGEGAHALLCDKLLVHRPGDRHPTALRLPAAGGFVGLGVVPGADAAAAPVVHVASAAGGGEQGATALRLTAYPLDRLTQEPRTEPASLPAVSKANAAPHVVFARHAEDGVRCVAATGDDVGSAAISSDGRFVAVVGRKGGLRCYEVVKGTGGDKGEKGTGGEVIPVEAHGCPGSAGCTAALVCEVDAAAGVTEAAWLPAATGWRWHVAVVASGGGDGSESFVRVLDPFAGGRVLFEEACEGAPMLQRSACRSLSGLSFGVVAADSPRDVLSVEMYTLACSGGAAAAAAAAAAESGVGSGGGGGGSKEDAAVWQRAWDDSQQRPADVRLIFPHLPRTHVEALCRAPTPGLSAATLCAMLRHLGSVEDGVQHKLWLCLAAAAIICNPAAGELEAAKGEVLVPPREAVVRWYTVLAAARCRDGAWEELLGGLAASGRLTELAVVLRLRCRGGDGAVDAATVLAQCPAPTLRDDFVLLLSGSGYATTLFVEPPLAGSAPAGGDEDDAETRIPVEAVPQGCLEEAAESAILEAAAVRASRSGLLTHASALLEHARGGAAAAPLRHAAEELLAALRGVASADACALLFGARAPPRAAALDVRAHAARPPAVRLCAAVLAGCAAPRHYEAAHVRPDQQAAVALLCGPLAAAALAAGEGVVLPLSQPALCRTLRAAFEAEGEGIGGSGGGGEGEVEEGETDLAAELQQALSSLSPGFVAEGVNVPGALLEAMVAARRLGAARGFALKLLRGFQGADRHALGTVAAAVAAASEAVLAEAASLEDAEALERCEAALTMWEDDVLAQHPEEVSAANAGVRRCEDLVDYACQAARQRLFAWGSLRDRFPRAAAAVAPAPQGVGAAQAVRAVLQAYPGGELAAADVAALCRDAASLGLPLGDAALAVLDAAGEAHAVAACTVLRQAVDDEGEAGGEASAAAQGDLQRFTAKALERLGWETLPEEEWAYLVESAAAVCREDGFDALLDAFSEGSCACARRSRSRRGSRAGEGEGLVAGIVERAAQCVVHRGERVRGELEAAAGLAAVERAEAAGREAVREAERDGRHFAARGLCELEGDEVRGRLCAAAAESAARGGGLAAAGCAVLAAREEEVRAGAADDAARARAAATLPFLACVGELRAAEERDGRAGLRDAEEAARAALGRAASDEVSFVPLFEDEAAARAGVQSGEQLQECLELLAGPLETAGRRYVSAAVKVWYKLLAQLHDEGRALAETLAKERAARAKLVRRGEVSRCAAALRACEAEAGAAAAATRAAEEVQFAELGGRGAVEREGVEAAAAARWALLEGLVSAEEDAARYRVECLEEEGYATFEARCDAQLDHVCALCCLFVCVHRTASRPLPTPHTRRRCAGWSSLAASSAKRMRAVGPSAKKCRRSTPRRSSAWRRR